MPTTVTISDSEKVVHCHDIVTDRSETRPLAVIDGRDANGRWVRLFEVSEWDASVGAVLTNAPHFNELRMRYVRRDQLPS